VTGPDVAETPRAALKTALLDSVAGRLRRLVASMLLLLLLVGVAGLIAVEVATGQVGKLSQGYSPAAEAHNAALTAMLDSETAVRGYILTGNPSFLDPYLQKQGQALSDLDNAAAALDQVGEHEDDAALADERSRAQAWLTRYAEPIVKGPGGRDSVGTAQQQQGKQLFDAYRTANATAAASISHRRQSLRAQARRLHEVALPALATATLIAVLIAAWLAYRAAAGISRPLSRLSSVVRRLEAGDLSATANTDDGPTEARALARAVNALGTRARAEATADRDADQFRQRTRMVSSTIRRTTNGALMAEYLVRGLGQAFEADRVWLHTFADERVPRLTAQWQRDGLRPLPDALDKHVGAARSLADRLWDGAHIVAIDDHRTYQPSTAGQWPFKIAQQVGAGASIVVPVGDSSSAFGLLWVSMSGHSRHWTLTETGVAQHLAADLAHSLVQSHVIERQAQAVELLRELDQAKADFISTVSHELRTPLTSISGYLEMLQDGEGGNLPTAAGNMLVVIERNATRLRNLIEDLLTQSRIDAGRLRLDRGPIDLAKVLSAVHGAMAPLAASNEQSLELDIPPGVDLMVVADQHQIEQVFTNLVANAVKFTPSGGRITMTADLDADDDGVLIQVSDTGIGIPDDERGKLFSRFFRASNASAAALPGTGLGLAIVREIVERHGGAVEVESEVGAGSVFTVWLPVDAPPAGS
jgi:two-component system phosphate regulon sensor histidine kinase PhoR